jgi:CO/xanthine dehydrogenase Mo-binding subunit
MSTQRFDRGEFIRLTASLGTGLALALRVPGAAGAAAESAQEFSPNAWVRIAPDNTVTVMLGKSEMGQGVATGLPTLVAEELDASLDHVRIEFAPPELRYVDLALGMGPVMVTGGSTSLADSWKPLRQAGASARAMLVSAAARRWNVSESTLRTSAGVVHHDASGRDATYGSLLAVAATLPVPQHAPLKSPDRFTLIGKKTDRLDVPNKVNGKAEYGIDVRVPGMQYAAIARSPVFGGRVKSFDASKAMAVPGVTHVVQVSNGVAVVGKNTWAAFKGKLALEVVWDEAHLAQTDTAMLFTQAEQLAKARTNERVVVNRGERELAVKVQWTREDDIQHDFYRTMGVNSVRGILAGGKLVGLDHQVVSTPYNRRWFPPAFAKGIDPFVVADGADVQYQVPNMRVTYIDNENGIPAGSWRAPDANWNDFVTESFIDELAHAAGKDPLACRLELLAARSRAAGVLRLAAEKAGCGKPQAPGVKQGIAFVYWFGSYAAVVADVSLHNKIPNVHRVVAALDCGVVVNPDIVEQQIQGGINYGLSAALTGKITIKNGRVQQHNFYDFSVLHLADAPRIEVHLVPSTESPTGVGEVGVPPIAPAVGNAIFALTGKRVRSLPFSDALA